MRSRFRFGFTGHWIEILIWDVDSDSDLPEQFNLTEIATVREEEKLLDFIEDGKQIEKQNSDGRTALHIAATVGNTYAAELLVKKRKELLEIPDNKAYVPLLSAYCSMQLNTFVYLLEASDIKQSVCSCLSPGVNLLITAIFTKQYGEYLVYHIIVMSMN